MITKTNPILTDFTRALSSTIYNNKLISTRVDKDKILMCIELSTKMQKDGGDQLRKR